MSNILKVVFTVMALWFSPLVLAHDCSLLHGSWYSKTDTPRFEYVSYVDITFYEDGFYKLEAEVKYYEGGVRRTVEEASYTCDGSTYTVHPNTIRNGEFTNPDDYIEPTKVYKILVLSEDFQRIETLKGHSPGLQYDLFKY